MLRPISPILPENAGMINNLRVLGDYLTACLNCTMGVPFAITYHGHRDAIADSAIVSMHIASNINSFMTYDSLPRSIDQRGSLTGPLHMRRSAFRVS